MALLVEIASSWYHEGVHTASGLQEKMEQVSRRVLNEELLRLGAAQARAGEDQIQEMATLDASLRDAIESSNWGNGLSKLAGALSKSGSFNRWASIEQNLATSLELLRPPSSVLDV